MHMVGAINRGFILLLPSFNDTATPQHCGVAASAAAAQRPWFPNSAFAPPFMYNTAQYFSPKSTTQQSSPYVWENIQNRLSRLQRNQEVIWTEINAKVLEETTYSRSWDQTDSHHEKVYIKETRCSSESMR